MAETSDISTDNGSQSKILQEENNNLKTELNEVKSDAQNTSKQFENDLKEVDAQLESERNHSSSSDNSQYIAIAKVASEFITAFVTRKVGLTQAPNVLEERSKLEHFVTPGLLDIIARIPTDEEMQEARDHDQGYVPLDYWYESDLDELVVYVEGFKSDDDEVNVYVDAITNQADSNGADFQLNEKYDMLMVNEGGGLASC